MAISVSNEATIDPRSLAGPKGKVNIDFKVKSGVKGSSFLKVEYAIVHKAGPPPYVFTQAGTAPEQTPTMPVVIDKKKGTVSKWLGNPQKGLHLGIYKSGSLTIEVQSAAAAADKAVQTEAAVGIRVFVRDVKVIWKSGKPSFKISDDSQDAACRLAILSLELGKKQRPDESVTDFAKRIANWMKGKKGAVQFPAIENFLSGISGSLPDTKALIERFLKNR